MKLILGGALVCLVVGCAYQPREIPADPDANRNANTPASTPVDPTNGDADPALGNPAPGDPTPGDAADAGDSDTGASDPGDTTQGGSGSGSCSGCTPSSAITQCTSPDDCPDRQNCALAADCFRTEDSAGCTGVCRRDDHGKCPQWDPPDSAACEGRWYIPWDDQGCPSAPICICADGTARPVGGTCGAACDAATTCANGFCIHGAGCAIARCPAGRVALGGADCCPVCVATCRRDRDCPHNQECVRENGCAAVECGPDAEGKDGGKCGPDGECLGVCKPMS